MAKLKIQIDLDNAAFHRENDTFNYEELDLILDKVKDRAPELHICSGDTGYVITIQDSNGNSVCDVWTARA